MTDMTKRTPPRCLRPSAPAAWPSGEGVLWRRALKRWLDLAPSDHGKARPPSPRDERKAA